MSVNPPIATKPLSRRDRAALRNRLRPSLFVQPTLAGEPQHRPSTAQFQRLVALCHRRWAIPILAELHTGDTAPGAIKFITLIKRLGVSRDSLAGTLQHLLHHDYIMRNPGYGHPMRPEYLLAEAGHEVAAACAELCQMLKATKLLGPGLRKWSLPAILAIGRGSTRFNEMRSVMAGISARALTLALKELVDAGLASRRVLDGYPPSSEYALCGRSSRLLAILKRI